MKQLLRNSMLRYSRGPFSNYKQTSSGMWRKLKSLGLRKQYNCPGSNKLTPLLRPEVLYYRIWITERDCSSTAEWQKFSVFIGDTHKNLTDSMTLLLSSWLDATKICQLPAPGLQTWPHLLYFYLKSSQNSPQFIKFRNRKNINIHTFLLDAQSFPWHYILYMKSAGDYSQ